MKNINNTIIPHRSEPGKTMPAPTVRHRDVGDNYATGVAKIKKFGIHVRIIHELFLV